MCYPRCLARILNVVIVSLLTSAFLVACSVPLSFTGTGDGGSESEAAAGEDDVSTSGESDSVNGSEGDSFGEYDIPSVSGVCPVDNTSGVLEFNHNIEWGVAGMGKFKIEVQGAQLINIIRSIATYEPEDKVGVHNVSTEPIPVTVSAIEFRNCDDGSTTTNMRATVTGTCIDGVLTLYIQEYYEEGSVTMMCGDERDDAVELMFPIGAMEQPVTWSLSMFEVYETTPEYLIPFLGQGGSGGRKYILSFSSLP